MKTGPDQGFFQFKNRFMVPLFASYLFHVGNYFDDVPKSPALLFKKSNYDFRANIFPNYNKCVPKLENIFTILISITTMH